MPLSAAARPRRIARLVIASLTALPLVVATAPEAAPAGRTCSRADVIVRLRLNRVRYDRGERVRMEMTTKNVSKMRCKMVFGDGNRGTLVIRREGGRRVWWDEGCVNYTQAVVEERWRRGQSQTYPGVWNQRTLSDRDTCEYAGRRAQPGLYFARGLFEGAGDVRSNRVWFRLSR